MAGEQELKAAVARILDIRTSDAVQPHDAERTKAETTEVVKLVTEYAVASGLGWLDASNVVFGEADKEQA